MLSKRKWFHKGVRTRSAPPLSFIRVPVQASSPRHANSGCAFGLLPGSENSEVYQKTTPKMNRHKTHKKLDIHSNKYNMPPKVNSLSWAHRFLRDRMKREGGLTRPTHSVSPSTGSAMTCLVCVGGRVNQNPVTAP